MRKNLVVLYKCEIQNQIHLVENQQFILESPISISIYLLYEYYKCNNK